MGREIGCKSLYFAGGTVLLRFATDLAMAVVGVTLGEALTALECLQFWQSSSVEST